MKTEYTREYTFEELEYIVLAAVQFAIYKGYPYEVFVANGTEVTKTVLETLAIESGSNYMLGPDTLQ